MPLKPLHEKLQVAKSNIVTLQKGDITAKVTRYPHLNEALHGGMRPGDFITVGAESGMGKTHFMKELKADFMNEVLNPHEGMIFLDYDLEMNPQLLLVREIKSKTSHTYKQIYTESNYDQVMDDIIARVTPSGTSKSIHLSGDLSDAISWFNEVQQVCLNEETLALSEQRPPRHVVISIDHLGLYEDEMSGILTYLNMLKLRYWFLSGIIAIQFNRELMKRSNGTGSRVNPKILKPQATDFYQTSKLFMLSDIVMAIHNPFLWGIEDYMQVSTRSQKYEHLEPIMKSLTTKTTNLRAEGHIFHHFLKQRSSDNVVHTPKDFYVKLYEDSVYDTLAAEAAAQAPGNMGVIDLEDAF